MTKVVKKLAFGFHWCIAINDTKKELSGLIASSKANSYATVTMDSTRAYGFGDVKSVSGVRSAAAILSRILGDAGGVFIHQISPDECCFIAIANNLPVEGCDLVGSREEMIEAALDYITNAPGEKPIVYGDVTFEEFPVYESRGFDQFALEHTDIGKLVSVSKYDAKLAIGGIGALLISAAWFSPEIMALFDPPKKVIPQSSPQAKYHVKIADTLAGVGKTGRFSNVVMPGFTQFADTLPFSVSGWTMESLQCEDTSCKAVWKRTKGGNAEGILAALKIARQDSTVTFPTVDKLQKELHFTRISKTQQVEIAPNGTLDPKVLTWIQDLKDRGFDPKYGTPVPLVAVDPGLTANKDDNIVVGDYSITLPYREIAEAMKIPNSMTVDKIEVKVVDGKIISTIQGKYYAN